ncbi:unnamed protein product [Colletotrichum noveboracense]|uniref:Uncharacterized protein n=1 Tax=Colletotrichum noveboracense TaxID=2664923 RepID=A0A9W4RPB0_9PEZI|nr:unnamed protein product [Colletotrichum noveboracense]
MDYEMSNIYILNQTTDAEIRELCHALWDWNACQNCQSLYSCDNAACPWSRLTSLKTYFDFYKDTTACYAPETFNPALRSHGDLIAIIRFVRDRPSTRRDDLVEEYFNSRNEMVQVNEEDKQRAFNMAVRILLIISCCADNHSGSLLGDTEPSVWHRDESLNNFVSATFPKRDHPSQNEDNISLLSLRQTIRATKLKKIARISFRGTNDIRNHLKLDQTNGVVELYHHTAALKECLKASKTSANNLASNIFPRQLLLETIDSLERILFPMDNESLSLLRSLVSAESLDPDCQDRRFQSYRLDHEKETTYNYWGSRLMDLCDEIENPKPRGHFGLWLKANSKDRHVMLATLVGISVAILLGILSLVVGLFQAWIAYEAWKHPVNDSP